MNTQPIEKQDLTSLSLDVQGKPWLTIQGEGPFAGQRATFVRLAGCQILCPSCDTDYTSNRHKWEPGELVDLILTFKTKLVVITGGEPFRQPLSTLVGLLLREGLIVQIETNGGLYQDLPYHHDNLYIVCSPKTGLINNLLLPHISAWKYVVEHDKVDMDRGLPISTLGRDNPVYHPPLGHRAPIYIQPLDRQDPIENELNLKTAAGIVLLHDGFRLCIQSHKLAGLP